MSSVDPATQRARLPRTVFALGLVSFFTDFSSELIVPLLPVFLQALGAGPDFLGYLEGAALSFVALLRLVAGTVSDRMPRRKPLIVFGYGLSSVLRPLMALAQSPWHVFWIRLGDRTGKGVRGSPRDALVADVTPGEIRGRAFGFQRAMDHTGALLAALCAFLLLSQFGLSLRELFAVSAIPAALAIACVVFGVREAQRERPPAASGAKRFVFGLPRGRVLRRYLVVIAIFTLGNSSDLFLVWRAVDLGMPVAQVPLLWAAMHIARALLSKRLGALSDRIGRRPIILSGMCVYALVYLGFGFATELWHVWALIAIYGLHDALTEGAERAFVADLAEEDERGRAFGAFYMVTAVALLPASIAFGEIWVHFGPAAAFHAGAGLAILAAVLLATWVRPDEADPVARP